MNESISVPFSRVLQSLVPLVVAGLVVLGSGTDGGAQSATARLETVRALTFDVFGTVVDWRSSIIRPTRNNSTKQRARPASS